MLRILVALIVAAVILLVAAALAGTAIQTQPVQVRVPLGPERGPLRLVP